MNLDFKDKAVLITGAGRGVGKQTAIAFANAGAKVAITARNLESLSETETELSKIGATFIKLKLDVAQYVDAEQAVKEAVDAFGKLDFLVNNASGYLDGWDLREFSVEDIEVEIDTTYKGVVFTTKAVLDHFITNGHSTIVNVASTSGLANVDSDAVLYAADKSAVIRFSERMHKKLLPYDVRVCTVVPYNIRSENLQEEEALSELDVARAILLQCADGDNVALQTVVLEPRTTKR